MNDQGRYVIMSFRSERETVAGLVHVEVPPEVTRSTVLQYAV
jgi:ribosomal protein S6